MAIHFKGPFFLTQQALPLLQDGGRIINISSGLARFSYPGSAAYAAMKGAIEVLTRYQAVELGARRIAVNVVAPGAIATDFGGGHVRDNPRAECHYRQPHCLGPRGRARRYRSRRGFPLHRGRPLAQWATTRGSRRHPFISP